jgi:hypothetical protein
MDNISNTVNSYIGDPIENPPEAAFLRKLARDLAAYVSRADIYANFCVGRSGTRQVDFLVRTPFRLAYVELKSLDSTMPVIGGLNGPWAQRRTDGTEHRWDDNAYRQTRGGVYAVSDAMRNFASRGHVLVESHFYQYVDAVVCFDPVIPDGSSLQRGDYVTYVDYKQLIDRLATPGPRPVWSDAAWEEFGRFLRVYREEPESPESRDRRLSEQVVGDYRARFVTRQTDDLHELIPTTLAMGDDEVGLHDIHRLVASRRTVLFAGPHGAGKSHAARHLGLALTTAGHLVVWLRAGEYEKGRFGTLLSKSIAPFTSVNAADLLVYAGRAGVDVSIVIDGLNECPQSLRKELVEQVSAFRLRNSGGTIITATSRAVYPDTDCLSVVFRDPDSEERELLLGSYGVEDARRVHDAFVTPYELSIAAACLNDLGNSASQTELLDAYIRHFAETEVIRSGLRAVAGSMDEELRTSLRTMDVVSILSSESGLQMRPDVVDDVISNPLLESASARVRFRHELLGRFLAAERCVLRARSGSDLGRSLAAPHHADLQRHALLIERSPERRAELMTELADVRLYVEAARGLHGPSLASVAQAAIAGVLADATFATSSGDASFEPNDWPGGKWSHSHEWTRNERALLAAAGICLAHGLFVEDICRLLDATDPVCFDTAVHLQKAGVKGSVSAVVAGTYSQFGAQTPACLGASIVLSAAETDWDRRQRSDRAPVVERLLDGGSDLPWGRLYLALNLFDSEEEADRRHLAPLVERAWQAGGYHLRLEALHTAFISERYLEPEQRAAVAEVLQGFETENIFLSTELVDALTAYDLIETGRTLNDIFEEIDGVLARPDDPEAWQAAASIIDHQFENEVVFGPYSQAVDELEPERRRELLIAAARAGRGMWLSWTIDHLAEFAHTDGAATDERIAAAIAPRAIALNASNLSLNEDLESHLAAFRAWVHFRDDLPPYDEPSGLDEEAWQAVDQLLLGIARGPGAPNAGAIWNDLLGRLAPAAVDVLSHLSRFEFRLSERRSAISQLVEGHRAQIRALLAWSLLHLDDLTSRFSLPDTGDRVGFIIGTLGVVGDEATVALLEPFLTDERHGSAAVSAIRQIRERDHSQ